MKFTQEYDFFGTANYAYPPGATAAACDPMFDIDCEISESEGGGAASCNPMFDIDCEISDEQIQQGQEESTSLLKSIITAPFSLAGEIIDSGVSAINKLDPNAVKTVTELISAFKGAQPATDANTLTQIDAQNDKLQALTTQISTMASNAQTQQTAQMNLLLAQRQQAQQAATQKAANGLASIFTTKNIVIGVGVVAVVGGILWAVRR